MKVKNIKYAFIILIVAIFLVLLSLTIYVYTNLYSKEITNTIIYNESGYLTHEVCLKTNDFILEECIKENRSFVTTLIKDINIDFNYQLDSSDLLNYNYNYIIKAKVVATEKGESDKILYVNEETLKEGSSSNTDSKLLIINESINLDYQKYNDIITAFKKNYVLAMDSNITISADINITLDDTSDKLDNKYNLSFSMPLASQTVNITSTTDKIKNTGIITNYKDKSIGYKKYTIYIDILFILDVLYITSISFLIIKFRPKRSNYNRKLKKILRNYDDIIVSVKKKPNTNGLVINDVYRFSELLDAKEALNKPIIFWKTIDKAFFMVIDTKEAYIYIINDQDKVKK